MKTQTQTNLKDNIATAIVMVSLFIGSIATVANSQTVSVNQATAELQQMDAIVITAQRMPIEKMNTIVVSASRHADVFIAAK